MSRAQQVAWFATLKDAESFEAKLYAQALKNGQKCDRWAYIIEDKSLGFGVPVKERVLSAVNAQERAKVKEWVPEERDGLSPIR